jgi:hypothetical protein
VRSRDREYLLDLDPEHPRDPLQHVDRRVRDGAFDPADVGSIDTRLGREALR